MSAAMTDIELIGYCGIHCATERALFSAEHVNRMIELAGNPPGFKRQNGWVSAHAEMQELCDLARARIVPPVPSIAPPVAAGSVDMQRYDHGYSEMVEDDDGRYVEYDAAIAWGAQQREQGHREGYADGKGMAEEIIAAIDKATQVRAEKAEAERDDVKRKLLESQRVYAERGNQIERLEIALKRAAPAGVGIVGSGPNAKEGDRPCWTPDCGTF